MSDARLRLARLVAEQVALDIMLEHAKAGRPEKVTQWKLLALKARSGDGDNSPHVRTAINAINATIERALSFVTPAMERCTCPICDVSRGIADALSTDQFLEEK